MNQDVLQPQSSYRALHPVLHEHTISTFISCSNARPSSFRLFSNARRIFILINSFSYFCFASDFSKGFNLIFRHAGRIFHGSHAVSGEKLISWTWNRSIIDCICLFSFLYWHLVCCWQYMEKSAPRRLWYVMKSCFKRLIRPFRLSTAQVPILPKRFTYRYERNKDYL